MENFFVLNRDEYTRDLDVVKHYVEDTALYLHKHTGQPVESCKSFVINQIGKGGERELTEPTVLSLTKKTPGNREKELVTFSDYIKDVMVNDRIISPTMAVYFNPNDMMSLSSEFIGINIKRRNESKAEMFHYKEIGDKVKEKFKKDEQGSFKTSNNSLSGAQATEGNIFFNESAHSSLTSTCRTATSYGNANNEKFLFGNRHYWDPEIIKANILTIIRNSNYENIQKAMDMYNLHYPTAEETYDVIVYSADLYIRNPTEMEKIKKFVYTLTDIERAAFVYSGDLYHLTKYNDSFVRTFLDKLSTRIEGVVENPDTYVNEMDSDMKAFVSLLCSKELIGTSIKAIKKENPEGYMNVASTAKNVIDTLTEYQWIIKAFWRIDTLPASIANIRSSIRRGVITSDTDSTIFTVQDWTKWFVGKIDFSEKSNAISYTVVYLATQTIAHLLAKVSAGMGVRSNMIHDLSMKNEFAFPVFTLTSMAKHYFAYISAQEGNVFPELDVEIKGVYLKDSNCPPHVMKLFGESLRETMDQVMSGEGVSLVKLLKKIASIENDVRKAVLKGDSFYLSGTQVKDKQSYANYLSSPYTYYLLWEEVFAAKYGSAPPPPYQAVKVSLGMKNKTLLQEWLDKIEDQEIKDKMTKWMVDNKKISVESISLPRAIVESNGIPEEIILGMNIRKLIYLTVKPFYFLLESLGLYLINDNLTRLVSDFVDVTESDEKIINSINSK